MSCVGQYFTASRAWAMGIGISGGAVGGVLFPIMLQKLIPTVGFSWAVRAIGFLLLVVAGCMCTAMKEFAPRRKKGWLIPGAWKQKSYVLVNMAFLLALMGCYTPLFYVVEYGLSHGMDSALAWRQVAIINAASFFGRLIPNFLGDRLGRINMSIVCYTVCAVSCLCWTTAKSTAGITVWNVAYGFFSGAIFSLFAPVVAQGKTCPLLSKTLTNEVASVSEPRGHWYLYWTGVYIVQLRGPCGNPRQWCFDSELWVFCRVPVQRANNICRSVLSRSC